jgi:tryptophan 2,3-dioxygenase
MSNVYNPADDGAQMNFDGRMGYGDYLQLGKILSAQQPLSSEHDELLFIIQHQTSELWIKLAIHEMCAAVNAIKNDDLRPAFKMLTRVARIFEQLNNAWDVLRTMTPSEYTTFRDDLGQSSGFQSAQYREVEYLVGNRNASMMKPHEHKKESIKRLQDILDAPSLYDEALLLLNRNGFDLSEVLDNRQWHIKHEENQIVTNAWQKIYSDPEKYWHLYELAEKLVDFEDYFRRWRFNHVTTVERIIGLKRGTGGTSGVSYLKRMLDTVLFPELWTVRTEL